MAMLQIIIICDVQLSSMGDLNGYSSEILELLRENPRGMSVSEISDAIHLNRNTTARYMDTLLVSGRVEMRSFGKAKVFFLSKRIPVSSMMNLSSEMVIVTNESMQIIQINDAALAFLGGTREETVGKSIYEGNGAVLCGGILTEQIRRSIRGEVVHSEVRLFSKGLEHILDQHIYPMVLADGNPGVTIILDDITAERNAEDALEQSESMFRRLVETVHDVIWSVDENGIIQYISPQITRFLGYTTEECLGKTFADFMPEHAAKRIMQEIFAPLSRERGFSVPELPLRTKDGGLIYGDFTGTPVHLEEDTSIFLGYNGAFRDVSGRRRAEMNEKRWRFFLDSVMEHIPSIILVSDIVTHQCYLANHAAERFFRYSRTEILHKTLIELLRELQIEKVLASIIEVQEVLAPVHVADTVRRGKKQQEITAKIVPMVMTSDKRYLITIINEDA